MLLLTTSAVQIAGVAYVQPGGQRHSHVAALSATALANVRTYIEVIMFLYFVDRQIHSINAYIACRISTFPHPSLTLLY